MEEKTDGRKNNKGCPDSYKKLLVEYEPHWVDLSSFPLAAECIDGNLTIYKETFEKDEHIVYVIQTDEDMYVGSSNELKKRIYIHYYDLRNGKHYSLRMQEIYNEKRRFKVYILMRMLNRGWNKQKLEIAEHLVIRLLSPSMNSLIPRGADPNGWRPLWDCSTYIERELRPQVSNQN